MKKIVYRYYCQFRPPMPGAIPRHNLDHVGFYDTRQNVGNGISAWGYAEYTEPLTHEEVHDYELTASPNNPLEYEGECD